MTDASKSPSCRFIRLSPTRIRCEVCGTEREHSGNATSYVRPCGAPPQPTVQIGAPQFYPCAHRGEVIERGVCNVCGMKGQPFEIHACDLHGRCMEKRYRNDRPGIKVCLQCEDYQSDETQA